MYNDGKTLLQINKDEHPLIKYENKEADKEWQPQQKNLGQVLVKGEIIDPKCYFGVMKPGEGKAHRDCAIRCILGGINPVMMIRNAQNERNYFLMLGPNGEKVNIAVQDFVAEPVSIQAQLVQYDDWIVMYMKDQHQIKRINGLALLKYDQEISFCGTSCMPANVDSSNAGAKNNVIKF